MTETTEISTVNQIHDAIKTFEKTQQQYRGYGANDTEPDSIFQNILLNAVEGKEPRIPRGGISWELYASSKDCETAAAALHDAAFQVVKLIENCRLKEIDRVRRFITDYCWRFR